jgi:hypothetical protein
MGPLAECYDFHAVINYVGFEVLTAVTMKNLLG